MSKDTYIHFSFDLKMRSGPQHGALVISIMSRKWIDVARDDFPSLSFPLYVFTVSLHRLKLEIAPFVTALWERLYKSLSVKTQLVCNGIALYRLVRRELSATLLSTFLNFSVHA